MQNANPLAGRAFTGPGGEERAFRAGLFLRAAVYDSGGAVAKCRELGIPLKLAETKPLKGFFKASGESITTAGGFLAPNELQAEILSLRDLAAVYRSNCRVLPMGSDSRSWPRRTGGIVASFIAENTTFTDSTAAWDNINFSAKKLGGLVNLPSELYEDETVGLAQWFAEELAYSFASKEDDCGFNGDGTSTYSGIRGLTYLATDGNHNAGKYTAASGHNTFNLLDASDIAGLIGTLPEYAMPGAAFYCSNIGAANTLFRLGQSSGAIGSIIEDGKQVPTYLTFPIRLTPKLPAITTTLSGKVMMLFGDLRLAGAIGNRRGVTVQTSDQRFLDTDQIAVRGTQRFDLVNHDMGDNQKAGPIVALAAP
jgi:HK97 family phage major capsid protein